jgi:hypothetical protein
MEQSHENGLGHRGAMNQAGVSRKYLRTGMANILFENTVQKSFAALAKNSDHRPGTSAQTGSGRNY